MILAVMPAGNAAEAHRKVAHLAEQLDRWARAAAPAHRHEAALRALEAVIAAVRARWGLGDHGPSASQLH